MTKPAATTGHSMIVVAAPSGNWKIRAHVGWPVAMTTSTKSAGMVLRDSVSSKIEFFGWGISPGGLIWSAKYTDHDTFSATRSTLAQTTQYLAPAFLEIEKDATNYTLRFGNHELGLSDLTTFTHTNFLDNVADQIGLTVNVENAAGSSSTLEIEEFYRVA
jgi:hypothetical protein